MMAVERKKVMVHVLKIDSNELPDRLDECAAIFQKAWDDTPDEHRANMSFYKWGHGGEYESPYVEFEAYYLRDETDEEMLERVQKQEIDAKIELAQREAKERALYEALNKKYGAR